MKIYDYGLRKDQPVDLWYGKHWTSNGKLELLTTRLSENQGVVLIPGENYTKGGVLVLYLGRTKLYHARRFASTITGTDLQPDAVNFQYNIFNTYV